MTIGEVLDELNEMEIGTILKNGFANPHSYRGFYDELSVEPKNNVKVSDMIHTLNRGMTETFEGYKGGDYTYNEDTTINLALWGSCGNELEWPVFNAMLESAYMDGETEVKEKTVLLKRSEAEELIDALSRRGFNNYNDVIYAWEDAGLVESTDLVKARILAKKAAPGSGTEPSIKEVRRMIRYYENAIEELENE